MKDKRGLTLVEILVVVGILALLAAIALPNLLRAKVSANEAATRAALRAISNSLENYAIVNHIYPSDTNQIIGASPPYLSMNYFSGTHFGYNYSSSLTDYTYTITATPVNSNTGTTVYTITTGGVLSTL